MILVGHVLDRLRELPDESVHMCVTSPPYFGLRAYKTEPQVWGGVANCQHEWSQPLVRQKTGEGSSEKQRSNTGANGVVSSSSSCINCGAWRGHLGLEPTPEIYVQHLVEIFREVRRVLRKDGTFWLNIGDSYAGGGTAGLNNGKFRPGNPINNSQASSRDGLGFVVGCKPKDLIGIPWMLAFALRADGWYLRRDIIWSKPNPMPESVEDRCTSAHEYLFHFAKSQKYYYDAEAIKESGNFDVSYRDKAGEDYTADFANGERFSPGLRPYGESGKRNKRSVWTIATEPFSAAHFATFPQALVEPCIKAGTSAKGVCSRCAAPWVRVVERKSMVIDRSTRTHELGRTRSSGTVLENNESRTIGWSATCKCDADVVPATVLEPFLGSGTTAVVANRLNRNWVGVELSEEYARMSEARIAGLIKRPKEDPMGGDGLLSWLAAEESECTRPSSF